MTKSLRSILGIPVGLVAAIAPASAASAETLVGSPSQTNSQQATTGQVGSQSVSGGVVVGDLSQSGSNRASSTLTNDQSVANGGGSVVVGSPSQQNSQAASTGQRLGQGSGSGGVHVGDTTQSGSNKSSSNADNTQQVGVVTCSFVCPTGSTVVGSPKQSNSQTMGASQTISQSAAGGVIVGAVTQRQSNSSLVSLHNHQDVEGFMK